MTLKSAIHAGIAANLRGAPDLGELTYSVPKPATVDLPDGTAAGKADLLFTDTRSIAASGNEDLDLTGGLTDPFGVALTFVKIKAIYIKAAAANGGNITISPAAANGFDGPFGDPSDQIILPAGGIFLAAAPSAGWPVTAGTGDLLNIANSDGAAAGLYDIEIIGTSA